MRGMGRKESRSQSGAHGLGPERAAAVTDYFKLLSNVTRVRIVSSLMEANELTVTGLVERVDARIQAVSNQLRLLEAAGVVSARRHGKNIFYRLVDEGVAKVVKQALVSMDTRH